MFKHKQKVSHRSTYHKPSFRTWLRYTREAKLSLFLTFVLAFGSIGYVALGYGQAASSIRVISSSSHSTSPRATFSVDVRQPNGQWSAPGQYGTRTTPVTLTNDGEARLTFLSVEGNSVSFGNNVFSFWRMPDGSHVTNRTVTYLPSQYGGSGTIEMHFYSSGGIDPIAQGNSPPTQPGNVKAQGVSPTQIDLSWTASTDAGGAVKYVIYRYDASGQKFQRSDEVGTATKFSATGLSPATTYTFYVIPRDNQIWAGQGGVKVVGTTLNQTTSAPASPAEGTPATPAAPQPNISKQTAATRPSTNSKRTITTTGATTSNNQVSSSQPVDSSDTTVPSAPNAFYAVSDEDTGLVQLGWLAADDNVAVSHYVLERSENQQDWTILHDELLDLNYIDEDIKYETLYYYRLKAVDVNANSSEYVGASLTTPTFKANVTIQDGGTFATEDNWLSVSVPAESVEEDAQCSIKDDLALPPGGSGDSVFAGPYKISCRTKSGQVLDRFAKPAIVVLKLDEAVRDQFGNMSFYTGTEDDWSEAKAQVKGDTVTFNVQDGLLLAGVGRQRGTPLILKIFLVVLAVAALGGAVMGLLYLRYRSQQTNKYEDYYRQQYGL